MKKTISLILALVMLFGICGCSVNNPNETTEGANGEVKYAEWVYLGQEKDLDTADPYGGTTSMTEWFTNMTFDTVIYNNPETGEIEPELAYKWEGNEDNSEWTFYLNEGVTFHNGDPMTAEDVKFTYLYAANLDGATNVVKTFTAGTYSKEVEIIDDHTIKFILNQPMPDFPAYMEMKVYSKNAIETLGHAEGSVIGTGPYYYDTENTVSGQIFVATRNEDYWQGTENYKSKHIGAKVYGDVNALTAALQASEIDLAFTLNAADYDIIDADPKLVAEQRTGCASYYLGYNYTSKNVDMNDVEIRRAIAQCIDKDSLVDIAWNGFAQKSTNFCAPSGLGYSEDVKGLEYDPEAGSATLQAKGVKELIILVPGAAPNTIAAEVVQSCLSKAGINVTIYKYLATCVGAGISGLGGLFYVMDYIKGTWANDGIIEGLGWLAVALVIFTTWKPINAIWGSYLFGFIYWAYLYIPGLTRGSQEIFKMLPYVVTLVVLIIVSMRKKRENQPPAALGLSYFREER